MNDRNHAWTTDRSAEVLEWREEGQVDTYASGKTSRITAEMHVWPTKELTREVFARESSGEKVVRDASELFTAEVTDLIAQMARGIAYPASIELRALAEKVVSTAPSDESIEEWARRLAPNFHGRR